MPLRPFALILPALLAACNEPLIPPDPPGAEARPGSVRVRPVGGDSLYELVDLGPTDGSFDGRGELLDGGGRVVLNVVQPGGTQFRVLRWDGTTLSDIGSLGGPSTQARGITDGGAIVGWSSAPSGQAHAFVWSNGQFTDLGTLGGDRSDAYAANENGVVVGESVRGDSSVHAFRWEGGVMTDLGTLGGPTSRAVAINRRGDITGVSTLATPSVTHTFRWSRGRMVDLGPQTPGVSPDRSAPLAIADDGTIVGQAALPGIVGTEGAFRARRNTIEPLQSLEGRCCGIAGHVNNNRMIAGEAYWLSTFDSPMGVVWRDGVAVDIGALPFERDSLGCDYCVHQGVYVHDLNERGQVVGRSTWSFSAQRAYVWEDGTMRNLGTLGGLHSDAFKINEQGVIAGVSTDAEHRLRWVVWVPRDLAVR